MSERVIRIGTRGSPLALVQARLVEDALQRVVPAAQLTLVPITTKGDRDRATSLTVLGGSGVFVKELHEALLRGQIDLAVHSVKDLPTQLPEGLALLAVLPRADARDVLVARLPSHLADLPVGARVGTSSRRRQAFVRALRPDLTIVDIRGNVDTRLRKLANGEVDALILAAAGLERLGRLDLPVTFLEPERFVPAPGQGAIGIVARRDDPLGMLLAEINDPVTFTAITVERAFLAAFGGGCTIPIGAFATVQDDAITLRVAVASGEDGPILWERVTWLGREALEGAQGLARRLQTALTEHRFTLSGPGPFPLAGRRFLVVRPTGQERELVEALQRLGAEVLVNPLIAIEPPEDVGPLDRALWALSTFDWVVFTSANGVRATAERLEALGIGLEPLRSARLAAIGPATARALRTLGAIPELVPSAYVAEAVAEALVARGVNGLRILLPRAAEAREILPHLLERAGAQVTVVPAYRTVQLPLRQEVRAALLGGDIHWILLTSSSTVRSFAAALGDLHRLPVRIAAIGPVTAATARSMGLHVDVVAQRHTSEGLIEAVLRAERGAQ